MIIAASINNNIINSLAATTEKQWYNLQMFISIFQSQAQFLSSVRLRELKNKGKV